MFETLTQRQTVTKGMINARNCAPLLDGSVFVGKTTTNKTALETRISLCFRTDPWEVLDDIDPEDRAEGIEGQT
jgi:hypothetical protein